MKQVFKIESAISRKSNKNKFSIVKFLKVYIDIFWVHFTNHFTILSGKCHPGNVAYFLLYPILANFSKKKQKIKKMEFCDFKPFFQNRDLAFAGIFCRNIRKCARRANRLKSEKWTQVRHRRVLRYICV